MQLPLATALILVAVVASLALVVEREHRLSPLVALGAAAVQALLLFDLLDIIRHIWRIDFILPAVQFVAGYSVWTETTKKRSITAATVLLAVTMLEMAILLGRVR